MAEDFKKEKKAKSTASRYTRFVKVLKLLLPSIAALIMGMILIWPQLISEKDRFKLGIRSSSFYRSEKIQMKNARFFATDRKNQPYSLTAEMATETAPGTLIIELTTPKADIMLTDGSWLAAEAKTGFFNQKEETLDLSEGISVFHDQGYNIEITDLMIKLREGSASSTKPVTVSGIFGSIVSQGINIFERGARVIFTGKTTLVLHSLPKKG